MFKRGLWLSMPLVFIYLCHSLITGGGLLRQAPGAHQHYALTRGASCVASSTPDVHSLLIVLLDRSASLAQTDPAEYSTSVTRILADLWPGRMSVIFFRGTTQPLPQLGPVDLSQPGARVGLQTQIEAQRNTLNGDTPTQYAVEQAASLLAQNAYPRGSEVMLITDGQPFLPTDQDGTRQIAAIEQQDAPVFCQHGVPINTFGLGNQVPTYTQAFLRQVAIETGGVYQDITDPVQLAQPILQLYAQWQHLKFVSTGKEHQFYVDTYARQVDFIAFLSNSAASPVTLLGPDNQPVPPQELLSQARDIHYQLDQMATQRFNTSGTYTIQSKDASIQTYVIEETRLQVTILAPTPHTALYAKQPVTVAVALFDNNDPQQHIHPGANESTTIGLTYTLQQNSKTLVSGEKKLIQQPAPNDDVFSTQLTLPAPGTLTISISASYQYVPIPDIPAIHTQVLSAPANLCQASASSCQSNPVGLIILICGLLVLLALLLLLFLAWRRPQPFGWLEDTREQGRSKALAHDRTLQNRLLHASTISSAELADFDFQGAQFALQFKQGRRVLLATEHSTPSLAVWCAQKPAGQQMQPVSPGTPVPFHEHDRILVNGFPCATFQFSETASGAQE